MTLSDDLSKLVARAKTAEDRFAAAQQGAPAKLQQDVQSARDPLQKGTDQLRETAEAHQGKVAAWWSDVQTSWDDQIAIRRDIESKKAEHELKAAQRNADDAEEDAKFPIAYAYWAVEEAEYRLLDAALARKDAEAPPRLPLSRLSMSSVRHSATCRRPARQGIPRRCGSTSRRPKAMRLELPPGTRHPAVQRLSSALQTKVQPRKS